MDVSVVGMKSWHRCWRTHQRCGLRADDRPIARHICPDQGAHPCRWMAQPCVGRQPRCFLAQCPCGHGNIFDDLGHRTSNSWERIFRQFRINRLSVCAPVSGSARYCLPILNRHRILSGFRARDIWRRLRLFGWGMGVDVDHRRPRRPTVRYLVSFRLWPANPGQRGDRRRAGGSYTSAYLIQ